MSDLDDEMDEEALDEPPIGLKVVPVGASDKTIEKHFETGRLRVVQDKNDFFLPHVVDFVTGRAWGNLQPEYQRRLRWDRKKKSKLIESFIMNVPVPPVFLYEVELGRFEVMDGQQRLNAVVDFLAGRFALTGLRIWPALNNRTFEKLPPMVRRGLERAKISAITLMSDASSPGGNSLDLRAQVFERLNTGGERLNHQELRNSLYSGPFNALLLKLSSEHLFTTAWGIPDHTENILSDGMPSEELRNNALYKRMADVEIVLRFFAFRDISSISGSVRAMLDDTMRKNMNSDEKSLATFDEQFMDALSLCVEVFGDQVFRLPPAAADKQSRLSRPLYDAEMVAMHTLAARRRELIQRREDVSSAVLQLAEPNSKTYDLMVGRANTAGAIQERIERAIEAITGVL